MIICDLTVSELRPDELGVCCAGLSWPYGGHAGNPFPRE